MPQSNQIQSNYKEGQILLAISAIERGQIQSVRHAAKTYDVPRVTLARRLDGIRARRDSTANLKKLTENEEEVIIRHILDLDSRGFSPRLKEVADMANHLLASRGEKPVGIKWPSNFIARTPVLKTRLNRRYDYQRAQCEDPQVIQAWFQLVQDTIAQYGIVEDDIFNFDETGFQMGVISTTKVVTGSERRYAPKAVQPGNREWVTVIQGVGITGWVLPPFIIFAGTYHLSAWYDEGLPTDWAISLSQNGWTTNEIGLDWLKHFDKHTINRIQGTHRLLILDGHESHMNLDFKLYCEQHRIVTLCMPPHSSHLLQPLDIGCFGPLKQAYGSQIQQMMKSYIHHVTKLEFLPAFKTAFHQAITASNVQAGFRGAGLYPFNPDAVLSKLDIRLKTPTPPPIDTINWQSQTPSNALELGLQSELIRARIQRHQNSSPTSIIESLNRLAKGAQTVANYATLVKAQVADLEEANRALSARKKRLKRRIQRLGTLTQADGSNLNRQTQVEIQIEQDMYQNQGQSGSRPRTLFTCSGCGEQGHRINQCSKQSERL
jgi:hypothetical protein